MDSYLKKLEMLRELRHLNDQGFQCHKEIGELIESIKTELNYGKVKEEYDVFDGGMVSLKVQSSSISGTYNFHHKGKAKIVIYE